jgi:hypothetical protein
MWNIHRQLAGPSGLDCTTTIKVYKASGNSIFGDAEQGLWDRLINPDGFNPKAFKDALGIFLNKYGGDDVCPMVLPPNGADSVFQPPPPTRILVTYCFFSFYRLSSLLHLMSLIISITHIISNHILHLVV